MLKADTNKRQDSIRDASLPAQLYLDPDLTPGKVKSHEALKNSNTVNMLAAKEGFYQAILRKRESHNCEELTEAHQGSCTFIRTRRQNNLLSVAHWTLT